MRCGTGESIKSIDNVSFFETKHWTVFMQTKTATAAMILLGSLVLSGCTGEKAPEAAEKFESCFGGFDGWWNSTPADGDITGLPLEGVSVHSETGRKIDAFKRGTDGSAYSVPVEDIDFDVNVDPTWPKNNLVTIETATGKVLDIEKIPEQAAGCEPLAGSLETGFTSVVLQDVETGRIISEKQLPQNSPESVKVP